MSEITAKRVFLAGASGAIGRRLVPLLLQAEYQVTGTTRSYLKSAMLQKMGIVPVVVDVFDASALRDAVIAAAPDIVIHQLTDLPPGLDPALMEEGRKRNARLREIGTRHLVAASLAAGAKRMIAQSIAFAYAPLPPERQGTPILESDPLDPNARGVRMLEEAVLQTPYIEGIVLRYGKLYGPGTGFDAPSGDAPVHVDAAAKAALLAITRGQPGVYNIAEDDGTLSLDKARRDLNWNPRFRLAA
ncbi:NAD-dependent epimerase/dehydratase family protein [Dongia soli]|uniref:NAD(P)H-binding protein n=1 Tax=Dongia soli TaxID=600628 RepID=A0ABU5EEL5_9PROT|nr:NAD-dependent epimerase/dehydratase family protein [Dongia soli]MDY0884648.1 NAD(P)H-binding protein [Dongia soli]